jgi:adenosylcobyric acid synthase
MASLPHARAVMVLGTTSGAGKSWLTTALCRWYARQGLKVAPFKAQNMSNNARVVPGLDGEPGEIGSAQYFQALAAGAVPDVRMNPVLLKPEHDMGCQVVVMGQVRQTYATMPWRDRSEALWPHARHALNQLMADHDVVVIEGAGSPAEINLHHCDYVNMRTALHARAACLLVSDIDRGGSFAHLYGTFELLPPNERALIKGFVLNRFRGDASLLSPGPERLQRLTGVPTVAVVPMVPDHGLPEEDGLHDVHAPAFDASLAPVGARRLRVAVVACPRISNLDEFQPLRAHPGVDLVWARSPVDLAGADWVILPGSKHTVSDLAWLRAQGMDATVQAHAARGGMVLGICGGLQMLGLSLNDPDALPLVDVSSPPPAAIAGLGLLALHTHAHGRKQLRHTRASFGAVHGVWSGVSGVSVTGYEIHQGVTQAASALASQAAETRSVLHDPQGTPLGWQCGSVLGVYVHGLFEDPHWMQALGWPGGRSLDAVFDALADVVDAHFEPGVLMGLLQRVE